MRFIYLLVNKLGSYILRLLEGGINFWVRKEGWFIIYAIVVNENGDFVLVFWNLFFIGLFKVD